MRAIRRISRRALVPGSSGRAYLGEQEPVNASDADIAFGTGYRVRAQQRTYGIEGMLRF